MNVENMLNNIKNRTFLMTVSKKYLSLQRFQNKKGLRESISVTDIAGEK